MYFFVYSANAANVCCSLPCFIDAAWPTLHQTILSKRMFMCPLFYSSLCSSYCYCQTVSPFYFVLVLLFFQRIPETSSPSGSCRETFSSSLDVAFDIPRGTERVSQLLLSLGSSNRLMDNLVYNDNCTVLVSFVTHKQ